MLNLQLMHRTRTDPSPALRGALPALLAAIALLVGLSAPSPASAKVPNGFFGVSAVAPSSKDFSRMAKGGLGAYRFGVNWATVQRTRNGPYNWNETDINVRHSAQNGMRSVPVLFGTPRFVSKREGKLFPPTGSQRNLETWQRFTSAAAARYGPGGAFWRQHPELSELPVRSWVIWNEQNARPFWFPKASPRQYARLVKVSAFGIRGFDPGAKIVLGGIFGFPNDRRSMPAVAFLRAMYRVKGVEKHFDSVNLHPYGPGIASVKKQIKQARKVMRKAGDGKAGILVGEMGWGSAGSKRSPSVVGVQGQKRRISQGARLLVQKRRAWNIDAVYIYLWRDFKSESGCLWCPHAGLIDARGREKPAWPALKRVIRSSR